MRRVGLSAAQRKSLAAAANRLPARINVSPGALGDAVISHIRAALGKSEILKVRVNSRDRDECELVGMELAEKIGGEFVARLGHVVVLYRTREEKTASGHSSNG
jgi:RNA-binding protein YhbY